MTTWPPSGSEPKRTDASVAFARLHEKVRRWVWSQRWHELRDVQERAVDPVLAGKDVIIAAATAGGKTEAAFLPIGSALADQAPNSIAVLDVCPTRALINDQYQRLEAFCETLDIPAYRWHGDVPSSRKQKVIREPGGILLITPESLEALFVHHGTKIARLFGQLAWVVVDELHTFIGAERGRQLQSLLHRVELVLRRRVPRIGLSATLGDMRLAADYLRPGGAGEVELIASKETGQEIKLLLRGYRISVQASHGELVELGFGSGEGSLPRGDELVIAQRLFARLRGTDNLVFANSRTSVEQYADLLRRMCEQQRLPQEFFPHHGSLARDLREDVEARLKDTSTPVTVVCTNTLELGIDIGDVESIAQIGPPPSVASLRQRLGRSGRREGKPAVLRIFVQEPPMDKDRPPQDQIRSRLVQTVAMVELLLERWCEPPVVDSLYLSTLVQQVLSLIAQYGGVQADEAWNGLCHGGPFAAIDRALFGCFLRSLGEHDMIEQMPDGTLLAGGYGERVVNHFAFFAAFMTPEEFRIVTETQTLGTIPIDYPLVEGMHIIFAGNRWRVESVDEEKKVVQVQPAFGGRPPAFGGGGLWVHDRVRNTMLELCGSSRVPAYLDASARELLAEGREAFLRLGLHERPLVQSGEDCVLFPWSGDRIANTICVELLSRGLKVANDGVALVVERTGAGELREHLKAMAAAGPPDATTLAAIVRNKRLRKHHWCLSEELLSLDYASAHLDAAGAHRAVRRMVSRPDGPAASAD